jgi:hypothetical protein
VKGIAIGLLAMAGCDGAPSTIQVPGGGSCGALASEPLRITVPLTPDH